MGLQRVRHNFVIKKQQQTFLKIYISVLVPVPHCWIGFTTYSIISKLGPTSEKAMAQHSSTLAWKMPWTEEPGGLQSMGSLRVGHDWVTSLSLSCTGEGNGNPLQCSCLENPRDGGAWWAAVYGVAQSQTRLKWLSSIPFWGLPG